MAAVMAQPTPMEINGVPTLDASDFNQHVAPVKRKRDSEDEGATTPNDKQEQNDSVKNPTPPPTNGVVRDQAELVKTCFEVLSMYVVFSSPLWLRRTALGRVRIALCCVIQHIHRGGVDDSRIRECMF